MPPEDIERLRQAAMRDPAQLVRLADVLVAAGRADEAVDSCRRGLGQRPEDIPLRLALGRALSAAGRLEEAQAALLDAVGRQQRQGAKGGGEPAAGGGGAAERTRAQTLPGRPSSFAEPPTQVRSVFPEPPDPGREGTGPILPRGASRGDATQEVDSERIELDEDEATGVRGPGQGERPARRTVLGTPTTSGEARRSVAPATANPSPRSLYPEVAPEAPAPMREAPRRAQPDARPDYRAAAEATAPLPQPPARKERERPAPQPDWAGVKERDRPAPSPGPRRSGDGTIDLAEVASQLLGDRADVEESGAYGFTETLPEPPIDEMGLAWDARRARAFLWLWVALVLVTAGIAGGWIYRARERARILQLTVERADLRVREATDEGDRAARDAYASALRAEPRARKYFAMVALAAARLAADHGEDTDATAWAMLRRAEKDAVRHPPAPDPRVDRELRQARGLLALARGEPCPPLEDVDGDVAARCALQRGDVDAARRILGAAVAGAGEGGGARALLALGSVELGAGDLDAADSAYGKVLALWPDHPRAQVGRLLVAIERGETPKVVVPTGRLGPTTQAWFHLAAGLVALQGKDEESKGSLELDAARKGIVHDGRLALLYGRARLQEGQVGEAEQAMRIAERLNPNDADVAVLDAEVALAKGLEDKVVSALALGPSHPRKLAVLGRAQCLTGKYREGAATLDAALAKRPGDATAITYRAIARARLGDQAGAQRQLEKAAATLSSGAPHYGLGLLAYERKDLLRARTELGRALSHNSEGFRARALLGRVLRDLGKPGEALVELERAAKDAPALVPVHAALGRLQVDLGRYREARASLRQVLDSGKASAEDQLAYAEATVELGLVDEAGQALAAAIEAGLPQPRAVRPRLVLQSWKGPREAAAAARLLEQERRGPAASDPRLLLDIANAWRRAGNVRAAEDAFRAALFGAPLQANLGLGRLQLAQKEEQQAEQSFRDALSAWAQGPYGVDDATEARVGLARALLARRSIADAIASLVPALTQDPTAPDPHYWLARAYREQGLSDKAREQADKAVQLDDQYAEAFAFLGELTLKADPERARQAYQRYLVIAPDGPAAKTAKKALAALK